MKCCKTRMREMTIQQSEKIFHSLFQWMTNQLGKRPHINLCPWIDSSVCVCEWACMCVCMLSCVRPFVTPWTVACQTLLSMEFSMQRIVEWVALFYSRDLPNPGIQSKSFASPALTGEFYLLLCHPGSHNSRFSP